jgi:hypothetical protein
MKKRLVLCLLAIACVVSGAMAQAIAKSKANKDTEHWRYELQAAVGQAPHGCALVRVWSYSKNANVATMQAGKNAVHGIMFMGYPPSADGRRIPGRDPLITDRVKEEQYADFFDKFFADNGDFQRYVSYVGNGMPDQAPNKIGKEYKVPILVTVMVDELRKRLEQEGILAKMEEVMKGKMPTIMVVPSAMWCNKNGFLQVFDNQGKKEYVPDYEKALLSSTDLSVAINTINTLMANRGFPLKDLEASLKTIKSESAEDAMMTSKSGEAIAESPIDINIAKQYFETAFDELEEDTNSVIDLYLSKMYYDTDDLDVKRKNIMKVSKNELVKVAKKIHMDTVFELEGDKDEEDGI